MSVERDTMSYDVLIVGAGPSGLSAAIKLKQLKPELNICLLEKGAEVGSHILSGAVIEVSALDELIPDWQDKNFPINLSVKQDAFYYLTASKAIKLPTPPTMQNHGNYIVSLSNVCKRLAEIAEELGVEIYPGFPASQFVFNETKTEILGVLTGDMGIAKNGEKTANFQPGMALLAKQTILAEGCRGSLSKQLIKHFNLDKDCCPQTYGIGFKEIWKVKQSQAGIVEHTVGWPLDPKTYGGSFIYHLEDNKIAVGFVIGLDYENPWLSPFDEFQRFKTHPKIKSLLSGGERLSYGAKSISEGGLQSLPQLTVPGALIIGDSAGLLNVAKIKGTHTAMRSGIIAASTIVENLEQLENPYNLNAYQTALLNSSVQQELYKIRNIRPSFHKGLYAGLLYSAFDQYILRGNAPWTFKHKADHLSLKPAEKMPKISYPKPDGKITFDKPSSVFLAGTFHEENQPIHLKLTEPNLAIDANYKDYASPETRYCPAGVYEILTTESGEKELQINAQNCIHCKTCDIKDPRQNINWLPPEGGGGPNFKDM